MSRKRHQKRSSTSLGTTEKVRSYTPLAQAIIKRIADGGMQYLEDNIYRVSSESMKLTEEPEFIDLYMDSEKASQVTDRWFRKYEKRLAEAERKGSDEFQQVYDQLRIDVIAELATNTFQKDVLARLDTLLDRVMATNDKKKLEVVLFLQFMLKSKMLPWGIFGLVIAIYSRTIDKFWEQFEEKDDFINLLEEWAEEEGKGLVGQRDAERIPGAGRLLAMTLEAERTREDDAPLERTP